MTTRRRARRDTADSADGLPRDVWGAIARAALHLEGDDVRVWARLSLVNSAWRAGIQGVLSRQCISASRLRPGLQLVREHQALCS